MLFNSIDFLLFFPPVIFVLFVIPRKARSSWLLISSYYFYMSWNPIYAMLILATTAMTFAGGILAYRLKRENFQALEKISVIICAVLNLFILFLFKYANFFIENLNGLFGYLETGITIRRLNLLLPVGISFYTFQGLSYIFDIHRGIIGEEKNFIRYALYISFFPQLVAGPIERSEKILPQIKHIENIDFWNFRRIWYGFFLMMWGLFQKLVIADRAALVVNKVINNYDGYGAAQIIAAVLLFSIQVYCDFNGYTTIACGSSAIMGVTLTDNFRQPYFSKNIKEFWNRWHITLTSWFREYVYIPLGGNRKGKTRKYVNTLSIFLLSGLWHGASWNYVIWGGIHAVYLILNDMNTSEKKDGNTNRITCVFQIFTTFLLVNFAWIFFVCKDNKHAFALLGQIAFSGKLYTAADMGLDIMNWIVLLIAVFVLFLADVFHEMGRSVLELISKQTIVIRYIVYFTLIWSIIMLGIYGSDYNASTFIYFQF